jgi:hypothetical protein
LLQSSTGWASDAANLRQMITDYVGSNGTNIELVCTENNSVSSAPGKQSTSLVNGLFKADSQAQLMQTEFNGLFWWDLRNGPETDGNLAATLYGWRLYGDYGVVDGFTNLYPTYYTAKLMTNFVQAGDTVITAASDYSLLSTYAVRRQDGSLTVLTINKDPVNTLTGQVAQALPRLQSSRSGLTVCRRIMPLKPASARRMLRKQTFSSPEPTSTSRSRLTRPPCWRSHRHRRS